VWTPTAKTVNTPPTTPQKPLQTRKREDLSQSSARGTFSALIIVQILLLDWRMEAEVAPPARALF
jgi:hypothetical protein